MYRFTDKSLAPACRAIDTSVALVSLLVVLVGLELPQTGMNLGSLLDTRVTVQSVLIVWGMTLAWTSVFGAFGLYRFNELNTMARELDRVARACLAGSVFVVVLLLTSDARTFGWLPLAAFLVTVTAGTVSARAVVRRVLRAAVHLRRDPLRVIIAGTGPRALNHYRRLRELSYDVIGFVDTVKRPAPAGLTAPPFLGTVDELEGLLAARAVDAVHIALPVKSCYAAIEQVIATCERVGVESAYQADVFRCSPARRGAEDARDVTIALKVAADDYRLWAKRAIDICGAIAGLLLFSPVMLAAAVAIKLTGTGPVLFAQERFGYHRRRFRMWKFRTMVVDAEALQPGLESQNEAQGPVFKIRHDPRVTRVGWFLRRTSIDELPQLFHVLIGDMSLVGPRPLPVRDVSRFTEASLMRRFSVMPGLTCLWQINGRGDLGFDHWIRMDLEYIDRWSLLLDAQILMRTVPAVLRGNGAA